MKTRSIILRLTFFFFVFLFAVRPRNLRPIQLSPSPTHMFGSYLPLSQLLLSRPLPTMFGFLPPPIRPMSPRRTLHWSRQQVQPRCPQAFQPKYRRTCPLPRVPPQFLLWGRRCSRAICRLAVQPHLQLALQVQDLLRRPSPRCHQMSLYLGH